MTTFGPSGIIVVLHKLFMQSPTTGMGPNWSYVHNPIEDFPESGLDDVVATGPNDVWAIGGSPDYRRHADALGWQPMEPGPTSSQLGWLACRCGTQRSLGLGLERVLALGRERVDRVSSRGTGFDVRHPKRRHGDRRGL